MQQLQTVSFTKRFTSGLLKGLEVVAEIETSFPEDFRKGKRGQDLGGARWIIVQAEVR